MSLFSAIILTMLITIKQSDGYARYRNLIPNALRIPHPCNSAILWDALGHERATGGGARGPFGLDFAAGNYAWTKDFCNKDSDGDGRSNGAELGDPNCVWTFGGTPAVTDQKLLSHPGVCEPIDAPLCANKNLFLITVVSNNCPMAAQYNNISANNDSASNSNSTPSMISSNVSTTPTIASTQAAATTTVTTTQAATTTTTTKSAQATTAVNPTTASSKAAFTASAFLSIIFGIFHIFTAF